jgi:hypothetical protein
MNDNAHFRSSERETQLNQLKARKLSPVNKGYFYYYISLFLQIFLWQTISKMHANMHTLCNTVGFQF